MLESLDYCFGDDFVWNIAKSNWSKLCDQLRVFYLRDRRNEGFTKALQNGATMQNIKNKLTNLAFNSCPGPLVEKGMESIRPRGLVSMH